ncbi:RNA polymerase sigma factor [Agromyces sp. LHK192]|uniref:RNA polymerase sigma factor n=1 Tax=Agromyces sp. LHK192 TaxID=2498704 RepID=UPI000FDABAB1|nr:RNA polymerase sigma factor [Agromyces sp. LHK192]
MENRSDSSLWLEAIGGTESSFGVIYDRYKHIIYRAALARVANTSDAEDVVAIVFLEAWRKRADVRFVDGSLRPWLLVVMVNVTLSRRRSTRRHRRVLAKIPAADPAPDHSHRLVDRMHAQSAAGAIRTAIGNLNGRDRQIVELCLVEELSMAEAATALNVPVGTVKSRLSRIRRRLQVDLGAYAPGLEGATS